MNMRCLCLVIGLLTVGSLAAQSVRLGNVICNPGAHFSVPIEMDSVSGIASVSLMVTYDPMCLVLTDVRQGSLATHFSREFLAIESTGSVEIVTFGKENGSARSATSGTIAELSFVAREGSSGSYSDLTLAYVQVNERTMTVDLTTKGVTPKHGLLRSFAPTADCSDRLTEGAVRVAADTVLRNLTLNAGDVLEVSDAQTPVIVNGTLDAPAPIRLKAPRNGWTTATYTVLQTTAEGVTFDFDEDAPECYTLSSTETDGVTTYTLAVTVGDEAAVELPDGVTLAVDDIAAVRERLASARQSASVINVVGSQEAITLGLDLGLQPETSLSEDGDTLTARFALPTLSVASFDPQSGIVKVKVVPPQGASIAKDLVTGILHVYGTERLSEAMTEIESPQIDLTAYRGADTSGEVSLTVSLGRKTFIRVIAGRVTTTETTETE